MLSLLLHFSSTEVSTLVTSFLLVTLSCPGDTAQSADVSFLGNMTVSKALIKRLLVSPAPGKKPHPAQKTNKIVSLIILNVHPPEQKVT